MTTQNTDVRQLLVRGLIVSLVLLMILQPEPILAREPGQDPPPTEDPLAADEVIPEPLPEWSPPKNTPGLINQAVVYNPVEGTETYLPVPNESEFSTLNTAGWIPADLDKGIWQNRDFGNLSAVSTPGDWPWTPIVKLHTTWPSGIISTCSGVLVHPFHIMTAGHCIYTHRANRCIAPDTSCWAGDIKIMSGYDNGDYNLVSGRTATGILAWTSWTVDKNYDHDIAAVELRYPMGGGTGYYGYGYNNNDAYYTDNTFTSTGFPADSPYDGETMYTWSGFFDSVTANVLTHNDYAYGGQSGSGLYNDSNIVYAVLSHGNTNPSDPNPYTGYARITSDKYTTFVDWMTNNTPTSFDLAIYGIQSTPETFDRGDALTGLIYYLFNRSTVSRSASTYSVDFYLSTNDNISGGDIHLQNRTGNWTFNSLSGLRIVSTTNLPTIPDDICGAEPNGSYYYLGAILDFADANASNNETDFYQPARIWINDCDNYEPDDGWYSSSQMAPPSDFQTHDIIPATDEDWIYFTVSEESNVILETNGSSGDTVITLYNSSLGFIEENDDGGANYFSMIDRVCGDDPLPGGTYYLKIIEYNQNEKISNYQISLETETCTEDNFNFLPILMK